jgi:predicted metal-dependent phosphoesterase TrpH
VSERLQVEFHCHTRYSKDSLSRPDDLLTACRQRGIDRLVVTDHNTIDGALASQKLDPERVIVGEEIMTQDGELLAAYVREGIPPGLPAEEAIRRLRDQGAFISVSHPFDRMRSGHWEPANLLAIAPLVDAVETFNARCLWPGYNAQAQAFAELQDLPGTVGSDAHAVFEVGKATLLLPYFEDAASLKAALPQGEPRCSLSAPWVHLASRYAAWMKKRG